MLLKVKQQNVKIKDKKVMKNKDKLHKIMIIMLQLIKKNKI